MFEDWKNETILKLVINKIGIIYEILEYLGGGGLSKIYKIRHKGMHQIRILKVMDVNHILNIFEKKKVENINREFDNIKKRFIIEAKIYRKFTHPNIVEIFDIDFVKHETWEIDIPFLIMEYIEGKTLKEILMEKSPLEIKTIFKISADVLSALDTIHQKGIIHRDIKPSNIMIRDKNKEVVILDFGLAKDMENIMGITDTHTSMGTFSYTSPEMLTDSKTASLKTDIYSFGIVMYEMITGELPFKGNYSEVLLGHLNPEVSIPEELFPKNPEFYRELNRIIKKAMAKEAKDRYRSAEEFFNDLKELDENLEKINIHRRKKAKKRIFRISTYLERSNRETTIINTVVTIISILVTFGIFFYSLMSTNSCNSLYSKLITSAMKSIEKGEFEKARSYLNNTRKIKDTDEVRELLEKTAVKQREKMSKEFEELKKFLKGGASKKEKIAKSHEFLNQHKNIPKNNQTESMISETQSYIKKLEAEIAAEFQYQKHIDTANGYIKNGDYTKAEIEIEKARKIKNTEAVKKLSKTIENVKALEGQITRYNTIKDQLNLTKYRGFKKEYPKSKYLADLQNRLRRIDNVLPPESYWGQSIKKNRKGYYELKFGEELNGHIMIFIPRKGFWIDKYEVSWQQFRRFLQAEKMKLPPRKNKQYIKEGDEYPVVVTYENARKYCERYEFSLPTEDEWEYVAGLEKFTYPWGNESPEANGVYRANFDSFDDGYEGTAPVYSFEKFSSPFGVVNMAGNAWEWVHGKNLKGGGFFSDKGDLKIEKEKPGKSDIEEGFRCIKKEN